MILDLTWESPSEDSRLNRIFRRILRPQSVAPPTGIGFPEREVMDELLQELNELKMELGYRFTIDE
ncbi:hypothetical protein [Haladaptatus sp. DFWS20]|uniref:hypothetical protein n=1 Tax=Haladaptatus sp. DFWS20 TaxID=3403467 RepID=UPI003EBC2303